MKKKLILIPVLVITLIASIGIPVSAASFSATIYITGNSEVDVDEFTTLTADWETTKDVTRYKWMVNDVVVESDTITHTEWQWVWIGGWHWELQEVEVSGNNKGTMTYNFSSSEAGDYKITFAIWHHTQGRYAEESLTVTVSEVEVEDPEELEEPEEEPIIREPRTNLLVIMPFGWDMSSYIGNSNILRNGIDTTGIYGGVGYRLVISEGCAIERPSGKNLHTLYLKDINGTELIFTCDSVNFSKPCVLYTTTGEVSYNMWGRLVSDGEWEEVGSFTEIVDGIATLE